MGPGACLSLSAVLVFSGAWKGFAQIDAVGHEAALARHKSEWIDCGQAVLRRECQIAPKCDPPFAAKNDPFDGAETGGAEPHIAEQSRSWRAASGEREVMRGS